MSKWGNLTRKQLKNKSDTDLQSIAREAVKAAQQQIDRLQQAGYSLSDEQVSLMRDFGKGGRLSMSKVSKSDTMEDIMQLRQVILGDRSTVAGRRAEEKKALETIGEYYKRKGDTFKFSKIGKDSYSVMTGYDEEGRAIRNEWSRQDIADFWDTLHELGEIADVIYDDMFAAAVEFFSENKGSMSINAMKVAIAGKKDEIYLKKKRGY